MSNINEKISELIAKLPAELQPTATALAEKSKDMAFEEIHALISNLVDGNTDAAYQSVLETLNDTELAQEADAVISELQVAAKESAETNEQIKTFLKTVVTILLSKYGLAI